MTLPRKPFRTGGLAVAGLTVMALGLACGGGGSSSGIASTGQSTGNANILVTDAPSDNWSTVQVQVTKVTLVNSAGGTQAVAFSGTDTVNLVDLDSVGELLASAQVPVGTYDKVVISVNTDPTSMSLIAEGGATAVPPAQVHVVGNGTITFTLSTPLVVTASGSNAVQVDFDLSHPLFINQLPSGDVVLNFQVKQRPTPALLHLIQIHRHLGTVSSVGASGFVMATNGGSSLNITTDGNTLFYDADNHPFTAGSLAGMLAADGVMVGSRLQDDGSLYAVRVWYCSAANAGNLPKWSPEGHVVSVNSTGGSMVVDNADGNPRHINVTAGTTFTFQNGASLGTGLAGLAAVQHGFKVSVAVTDPLATPLVATAVNVERAVDSGFIATTTSTTDLIYGQPALSNLRSYPYSSSFSWWDYAQPSATSTVLTDFVSALAGTNGSRITGASDLVWNSTGTPAWNANTAVLDPVPLPVATIVTSYASTGASTGSMVISYTDPVTKTTVTPTIVLSSATGGGQTLVQKVSLTALSSVGLDAPANWPADLTSSASKVWVAAVPQPDGTLDAYSVVVLE